MIFFFDAFESFFLFPVVVVPAVNSASKSSSKPKFDFALVDVAEGAEVRFVKEPSGRPPPEDVDERPIGAREPRLLEPGAMEREAM